MTKATDNSLECLDEDTLHKLASGECTPVELSQCEEHVSLCRNCRELLESRSLDASWHQDLLPAFHNSTSAAITEREHHDSTLQDALKVLGPTDDPHMLGRIGSYEVVGLIGCGGMGVVFKAFDGVLNRFVAIKIMQPHLAVSGAARQRFAREGRAAAAVIDDCVLPIHAVSEWQGVPYLVMQYSAGMNLQKRIETEGPLKLTEILRVAMQTASGLATAHAQGLVHRDVKPSNILLDGSVERAMLTDFGLARTVDDASVTRTGLIAGTPQYMSPEQVRGEKVDARSDLFSLGATMYAMCTGRSPFRGESTYSVLHRLTHDEPRALQEVNAEIPSWLCAIINKLLSKQPDERYQSADELADLLEQCLAYVQQPTTASLPQCVAQLPSIVIPATAAANNSPHRQLEQLFGTRPPIIKWLAAAAFAFSLIFAGVLIVLELNKGTLTIECDADDVPIRIMQGDNVVERMTVSKSPQNVRIAAGNYVVEVDGDFQGVTIKDGKVSLTRHGVATVEISKNANLVLASNFQPGNIDGLRFGGRHERIDPRNRGYANIQVAEPGETNKYFASFPTLGNGIEEVGLLVSVEPPHEPTEPSNWKSYLVRASGIRRIKNYSACEASVEGKSFFKLDDTPYTVGYFQLQLDGEEKENVTVDMIAGSAHVNINYVVGLPNEQVRKVLKLDAPNKHSESWLSVSLQNRPQSAWASHLMKLDGWEYDRTRGMPNMIQQEVTLKSGETRTVSIEPADDRDNSLADKRTAKFTTPEALMEHVATCLSSNDLAGLLDCWTDAPVSQLVSSDLIFAMMLIRESESNEDEPSEPVKPVIELLLELLTNDFAKEWGGELQDAIDAAFNKEDSEALFKDREIRLLASRLATQIPNPRRFVVRFAASISPKTVLNSTASNEFVNDFVIQRVADTTLATSQAYNAEYALVQARGGWLIADPWHGDHSVDAVLEGTQLRTPGPNPSNEVPSSKTSPEFPPVKILVRDEDGKPLKGVRLSLFQGAAKEGGKNVEINATSDENGVAVDRILPFGNYSVTLVTPEGWQHAGSRVNVEFETGLNTTIVAPSPDKRAKLVVELNDELHSRPSLNELRFGELQEHRIGNPAYSTDQLPEPGEDLGGYEFFPTIVNGIEEVAIGVRFEIRRTIQQPAIEAKGIGSEWRWYSPDDSQASGGFVVTGNRLRWNLDHASWDGKSIYRRPNEAIPFFKLKSFELQVGAIILRLGDPQPLPYAIDVPAGDTVIFVTSVYGKPTAEVRKSLGWVDEDRSRELWLPAPIQLNSKWLSSIVATETWTPRNYGDGYNTLVGHLLRQQRSINLGETMELNFGVAIE